MKRTSCLIPALGLAVTVMFAHDVAVAQPTQVSYQGELVSDGSLFDGFAGFKFAIITDGGTTTLWSNDGTSVAGSEPAAQVLLDVDTGIFSVLLGSPPQDPLSGDLVDGVTEVDLRVWVDTGEGYEQMTDQPIASALFSLLDNPQVSFSARSFIGQSVTGGTVTIVEFGTEDISGPWFNNDTFTAPVAGVYDFDFGVSWLNTESSIIQFWIYINGSPEIQFVRENTDSRNKGIGYRLSLEAGDELNVRVYSENAFYIVGSNNSQGDQCIFSGHLVHR